MANCPHHNKKSQIYAILLTRFAVRINLRINSVIKNFRDIFLKNDFVGETLSFYVIKLKIFTNFFSM